MPASARPTRPSERVPAAVKGLGEGAGEEEEARERDDEGGEVDEEDSERRSCHTAAGQYLAGSEPCAVTLSS